MQKSNCCGSTLLTFKGARGASCYICQACLKACDIEPEGELTCSVCYKNLGDSFGMCLCLPSHGSWHHACDPHCEWWENKAAHVWLDLDSVKANILRDLCKWIIEEQSRRTRTEAIEIINNEMKETESRKHGNEMHCGCMGFCLDRILSKLEEMK